MERPSVIPARPPVPNGAGGRTVGRPGPVARARQAVRKGGLALTEQIPMPVLALLIAGVIPTAVSFYIGALRLSPYRVVLLAMTPFLCIQLLSGAFGRMAHSDRLVFAATLWMWASLIVNDGLGAIESGGILFLETCGAYLIGRCCIRTAGQWVATVTALGVIVSALAPLTIMESVTGVRVIRIFFAGTAEDGSVAESLQANVRMGFYRASGPFDHPILLGVIAAAATSALALVVQRKRSLLVLVPACLVATLCSISSGALASLAVTGLLGAWEWVMRSVPKRWIVFLVLFAIGYFIIEMLSNRSAIVAILSVVTLNPKTAIDRTIIWDWGFNHNAVVRPWFGLGASGAFNWVRPYWLPASVDNYFLYLMILYGIVPVAMLLVGIVLKVRTSVLATKVHAVHGLAWSWWIPMVSFVIAGWTVAFWNHAQIFFWFFVGAGSWIEQAYLADKAAGTPRRKVA